MPAKPGQVAEITCLLLQKRKGCEEGWAVLCEDSEKDKDKSFGDTFFEYKPAFQNCGFADKAWPWCVGEGERGLYQSVELRLYNVYNTMPPYPAHNELNVCESTVRNIIC